MAVPLSAVEADAEDVYTTELVGCGHAGWGNALCIVDPDTFVEKRADEVVLFNLLGEQHWPSGRLVRFG